MVSDGAAEDGMRKPSGPASAPSTLPSWAALADALPIGGFACDRQGRLVDCNNYARELWGRSPEAGDDRIAACGGALAEVLESGAPLHGREVSLERSDGSRITVLADIAPLFDAAGALVGAIGGFQDITALKRATPADGGEHRLADDDRQQHHRVVEAQLHQLQKMEAVGQLTGGIAHDFNNLLTAVMANIEMIAALSGDSRIEYHAAAALRAVKRGADLTQQLLAFSRKQRLEAKPVDVNDLVHGMHDMLLRTLGGTVRVELALADGLWPALIDANQIETALLNLAINARDAMPEGGTLRIATANQRIRSGRVGDVAPGEYVELAVRDSGTGMSPEVHARAFDPFFTTKEIGKGSGLGLSQVYGVAKQTGGGAEIESAPGSGTMVRLYLPRAATAPTAQREIPAPAAAAKSVSRRERVLVIDDDDDVREVLVLCLQCYGYEVVAEASGKAALEALKQGSFAAVVMDFAMPGMTGAELARLIKERWPDLPILFVTGYAETPTPFSADLAGEVILQKPFQPATLEATLRPLIEGRAAAANVVRLRSDVH